MRTIQMTLDDNLVREVDSVIKKLHTTRSAFTREALSAAVKRYRETRLEEQHRNGYQRHPVKKNEFGGWEREQQWGDE